jgi:Txe/YoeB family toxin of Txe-Axe toxin-antitoxin module
MLSDSLCEASEIIWAAIQRHQYSDEFKDELVDALTEMLFLVYKLDRMPFDIIWSKEKMRFHVLEIWEQKIREAELRI